MSDVMLTVRILNLTYLVRGLPAIGELKLWLDEHASRIEDDFAAWEARPDSPDRESAMLNPCPPSNGQGTRT